MSGALVVLYVVEASRYFGRAALRHAYRLTVELVNALVRTEAVAFDKNEVVRGLLGRFGSF